MSHQNTTFHQLLQLISRHDFEKCVKSHKGDAYSKGFSCWKQFSAMLFGQLTSQTGLRGIETGLFMNKSSLYHFGINRSETFYTGLCQWESLAQNLLGSLLFSSESASRESKEA